MLLVGLAGAPFLWAGVPPAVVHNGLLIAGARHVGLGLGGARAAADRRPRRRGRRRRHRRLRAVPLRAHRPPRAAVAAVDAAGAAGAARARRAAAAGRRPGARRLPRRAAPLQHLLRRVPGASSPASPGSRWWRRTASGRASLAVHRGRGPAAGHGRGALSAPYAASRDAHGRARRRRSPSTAPRPPTTCASRPSTLRGGGDGPLQRGTRALPRRRRDRPGGRRPVGGTGRMRWVYVALAGVRLRCVARRARPDVPRAAGRRAAARQPPRGGPLRQPHPGRSGRAGRHRRAAALRARVAARATGRRSSASPWHSAWSSSGRGRSAPRRPAPADARRPLAGDAAGRHGDPRAAGAVACTISGCYETLASGPVDPPLAAARERLQRLPARPATRNTLVDMETFPDARSVARLHRLSVDYVVVRRRNFADDDQYARADRAAARGPCLRRAAGASAPAWTKPPSSRSPRSP